MKYYTEKQLDAILDTMDIETSETFLGMDILLNKFKGDIGKIRRYLLIRNNSGEAENYIEGLLIPEINRRKAL